MSDESNRDRSLDAVNREKGINFPRWVQNLAATVLAAYFLAISFGGWNLRDSVRDNVGSIERIENECAEKWREVEEFHQWPRFTHEHARRMLAPIEKELTKLEAEEEELEKRLDEQESKIYEIPSSLHFPFTDVWQNRILENREDIAECGCLGNRKN